jgi:hypothetical protein
MIMARVFYLKSGPATMAKLSAEPSVGQFCENETLRHKIDRLVCSVLESLRKKKGKHRRASPN